MTVARPPHVPVVGGAARPQMPSAPAPPRASLLRRPPLWLAVTVCVTAIVGMTLLRLVAFPDRVIPIAYGLPLILFVWLRNRALLWFTVAAFTVITVVKFTWVLPASGADSISDALRYFDFALVQVDLFVIGAVVHMLIVARDWLETRNAELRDNNAQLEALNRVLAEREEDVARQNEELQSQTEELERQTEELRGTNEELTRREHVTEALLSLSRGLTTELTREEMMARVCEVLYQLLDGTGGIAVAILEQDGDAMRVGCHEGFGRQGLADPRLPMDRSFASLVLSRGRTAYIEDLSTRPDLAVPRRAGGPAPFAAVLASPLRTSGWPMGTLEVYRVTPGPWSDDDVALVESLAAQVSISLEALAHLQGVSQERRRFETVLRAVPVGIAVCGADTEVVRLNPAGAAMFSSPTEINYLDPNRPKLSIIYRDGRPIAHEELPLAVASRQGVEVHGTELEIVMPGARRVHLLANAAPIRDADGKLAGGVAAFVDITPLKDLQRELDTRRRDAEEASVRKTRFLAAVSHDIRTPANAISLLAELIRRTASNPALAGEVPELAKELHGSAMSLVELLGDVLDLARYDSGRLEIQETEFSLGELLDEEYRRFLPLAREKGLALDLSAPEQPVRLRTDRIKLSRVIGNLVGNAIKFTTEGKIHLEAAQDGDPAAPVIRVIDTGIGIAAEHQQHIFDEFVQLHNRERDRNKGTGLGLTICKRLVDAMGGTLSVTSEPGRGTTFTVTLPRTSVVP